MIFAFITMLFVRHGDNKPVLPEDKLEMMNAGIRMIILCAIVILLVFVLFIYLLKPNRTRIKVSQCPKLLTEDFMAGYS